jgi:cytoskeleton protein RodZ
LLRAVSVSNGYSSLVTEKVRGLETEQKEIQAAGGETAQQAVPQQAPQSVGPMLRAERERLGLSLAQITEKTRMRIQVVEAIENETWGSLPPPVFVRGFLRVYAKVLGISQAAVIDLYEKSVPPETSGQVPRLEPSTLRRRRPWLVLLVLILLVAVYGTWHFYPSPQVSQRPREVDAPSQTSVVSPPLVRPAEVPVKEEAAPAQSASREAPPVQSPSLETPPSPPGGETLAKDRAGDGDGWLSLTGIVKERTWLRITIDGKEEKEYLFQAGSKPQWRGRERFYMIIGNAGGIDFDLNGKRVGDLGKPGQVIRLTLPKDVGQRERVN